jgi:cytochrome c biogenesis protein CcmG, thiol:disulfide interchange protein DsbE
MKWLCACALLALASNPGLAAKRPKTDPKTKSLSLVGKPAPAFTLLDLENRSIDFAAGGGRVVLLSFWASWCPPCRAEMPALARLQKELAGETVEVVLVALDDGEKAQRYLQKTHLEARSLVDEERTAGDLYGVRTIPRAFVISRDGNVRRVLFGRSNEKALREAISAAKE